MTEHWHLAVGVSIACMSGFLIGTSLVLQKKGLLETQEASIAQGNEHLYLKSTLWWFGMLCSLGEICNFVAYAFSPAVVVTPLGAISVVVSAILSVIFLKEKINYSGGSGMVLCVIGSTLIVLHAPSTTPTTTIPQFYAYVFSPVFVYLVTVTGPKHGSTNPTVYISLTAICGAFLVNAAQGFGSSFIHSIENWDSDNQFKYWGIYPLMAFIVVAVIFQVDYLNKALSNFSTSIVTPLNFVFFSTATLVTSAVLNQGFNVATPIDAVTILLGFSVIVIGVGLIFQYNLKLNKLSKTTEGISLREMDPAQEDNPIQLFNETFRRPSQRSNTSKSICGIDPKDLDMGAIESIGPHEPKYPDSDSIAHVP